MKARTIRIQGMSCEHCEDAVVGTLHQLSGVVASEASAEAGIARVVYADQEPDWDAVTSAIEGQGFDVLSVE